MKMVNFQGGFEIDEAKFPWVARNHDGRLVGFAHAPIRDYQLEQWIDSVDGSYGEIILFDKWETTARETAFLPDLSNITETIKRSQRLKKQGVFTKRKRGIF